MMIAYHEFLIYDSHVWYNRTEGELNMLRKILLLLLCIVVLSGCMLTNAKKMDVEKSSSKVVLGIERVTEPEFSKLFKGKRLGLFTN